jgi:hypothetical protein
MWSDSFIQLYFALNRVFWEADVEPDAWRRSPWACSFASAAADSDALVSRLGFNSWIAAPRDSPAVTRSFNSANGILPRSQAKGMFRSCATCKAAMNCPWFANPAEAADRDSPVRGATFVAVQTIARSG